MPLRFRLLFTAALLCLSPLAATAAPNDTARSVLPIAEVDIRDGPRLIARRYAIDFNVGARRVRAGLDTGSVGLRLLPGAADPRDLRPVGGGDVEYKFNSGVSLDGPLAEADLRFGATAGAVRVQAVTGVHCFKDGCPAAGQTIETYNVMGNGRPGQGFRAIIGVRLGRGPLVNPLTGLGVGRWIVRLPRPGEGGGKLILNPTRGETAGFTPLRPSRYVANWAPGTVAGCVGLTAPNARPVCGPTLMDTGAPGVGVMGWTPRFPWDAGQPATLNFHAADGRADVGVGFRVGDPLQSGAVRFSPESRHPAPSISAGLLPFFAYDVLFDAERMTIAVRARPVSPNGPTPF